MTFTNRPSSPIFELDLQIHLVGLHEREYHEASFDSFDGWMHVHTDGQNGGITTTLKVSESQQCRLLKIPSNSSYCPVPGTK